jgi:hypothetical protein
MSDSIFGKKKKSRAWVAVPFVLLPLYLFFFPYPTGRESVVEPVWALDLRRPPVQAEISAGAEGVFSFRAGARFGYASEDGRLVYSGVSRYRVALSDKGFINYGSRPEHLVFMDPRGVFQYSVQTFGYPLLDPIGDVLYSINTDLGGLKRVSADGEVIWQAGFSSPITSMDVLSDSCLIGLLDGRAMLFDADGELAFEIDPLGSRIPVILGTALAENGELALVAGIDPQTLILVRGEGYETVRSLNVQSDFRREVLLSYGPAGRFLYLEQEEGLEVLEPGRDRRARLALEGRLKSFAAGREFAVAVSVRAETALLVVFRPLASPLAVASLPTAPEWSKISEGRLFVGLEDQLLRADLVER